MAMVNFGMTSIVTTATISAVKAAGPAAGLGGTLGAVAVVTFLVLLVTREAASQGSARASRLLVRGLTIGIAPLGLAFVMIAAAQLHDVLK